MATEANMRWQLRHFAELTVDELYNLLRLRSEVFVVEQNCVFLDMDNKDQYCYHLLGWQGYDLVAYTRLVPRGVSYAEYESIGRVVTKASIRGQGVGRQLMQESIRQLQHLWGNVPIKIGAQLYLKRFYESLGFEQCSEVYDEDGIPHISMLRKGGY